MAEAFTDFEAFAEVLVAAALVAAFAGFFEAALAVFGVAALRLAVVFEDALDAVLATMSSI
ncbi:hypothetical protein [Microvirga rosea]|uniref:hypothetical protein n=1 Tax=Microvirga rosea TaxID=2715425 RepID=UPI001D0B3145|nr:hypothetical protein [Microvirga rosea]MCB8822244.1 hypothetical protein [Microvirga rosea]